MGKHTSGVGRLRCEDVALPGPLDLVLVLVQGRDQVTRSRLGAQDELLSRRATTCRAERSKRSFLTCHRVSVSAARPLFTASSLPRTS